MLYFKLIILYDYKIIRFGFFEEFCRNFEFFLEFYRKRKFNNIKLFTKAKHKIIYNIFQRLKRDRLECDLWVELQYRWMARPLKGSNGP